MVNFGPGLSPRVQERLFHELYCHTVCGITPACAGKTIWSYVKFEYKLN